MSNFSYSFQKILDLKKKNREQIEYIYAELTHKLKLEKEKLTDLYRNKDEIYEKIHSQLIGTSITEINQYEMFLLFLEQQITLHKRNIYKIQELIEQKHKELIEIKIEEKKWFNLREKKHQEYLLEVNRAEQKELDEIASRVIQRGV